MAQMDVNSIVSGRNYDILTLVIAKLLTSRPFGDLSREKETYIGYEFRDFEVSVDLTPCLQLRPFWLGKVPAEMDQSWYF